jgi:hypothetical protein
MRIFISYSHRDKDVLTRLQVHLKPIVTWLKDVEVWDDTRITAGSKWQGAIARAIDKSDVAVLIISADFIASEFITRNELPPLLKSAQDRGTLILPVIAAPSLFSYHPDLAQFQAINDPSKPLMSLSPGEQEAIFAQLAETLYKHNANAPPRPKAGDVASIGGAPERGRESFLDDAVWTRLVKIGDWVYDQSTKNIVGGGMHAYLVSRSEYGPVPFVISTKLRFTAFGKNRIPSNSNINSGIVFGWSADAANPRYYNILFSGNSILLERIGFNGGDAFRDYEHISKEIPFLLEENRDYQFTANFAAHSIDLLSGNQLVWSFPSPGDVAGRVGIRPWRSQVHCSSFVASTVS